MKKVKVIIKVVGGSSMFVVLLFWSCVGCACKTDGCYGAGDY